jgi:hypothetical protein
MLEFKIELLRLSVHGVSGQEHRLEGIAERALLLLTDRLSASSDEPNRRTNGTNFGNDNSVGVCIDLDRMSDEQSANRLAAAMRDAIRVQAGY